MNKTLIVVLILLATFIGLPAFIGISSYVSYHDAAAGFENGLVAAESDRDNVLSNYGKKIQEAAQVPAMQAADLAALAKTALTARYGDEGSKAMFQMIKEQNPTLDQQTYVKLQNLIASGRDEFAANQRILLDKKRVYQNQLDYVWSGFWMKLSGYPKIDLAAIKNITDDRTAEAAKTGKEEALKLR